MNLSLISFTFVVNMERRNCCWRPPSKPGLDMNRNQQTTNYKLSITNYLHLSCNDRDKGAEVTFTLQSLGGSGGPTFQHHCVSFSGGPKMFLLLSPLFHDGHISNIIVFSSPPLYIATYLIKTCRNDVKGTRLILSSKRICRPA